MRGRGRTSRGRPEGLGAVWLVALGGVAVGGMARAEPARCKGEPEACLKRAWKMAAGDRPAAIALGLKACERRYAPACTWAGWRFTRSGPKRALALFRKGCRRGDPGGCEALGRAFAGGGDLRLGVKPDRDKSARFFAKALSGYRRKCDGGDGESCQALSHMYWWGRGVRRDDQKRYAYLRRACELKVTFACYDLGQLRRGGAPGLEVSYARAGSWMEKACALGAEERVCREAPSMLLGWLLTVGPDKKPDAATVEKLLARAQEELGRASGRTARDLELSLGAALLFSGHAGGAVAAFDKGLGGLDADHDRGLYAVAIFGRAAARDAAGKREGALADYQLFLAAAVRHGRSWALLPMGHPIRPDAAVAYARARVAALRRR